MGRSRRPLLDLPAAYRVVVVDRGLEEAGLTEWWNGLGHARDNIMLRWEYLDAWREAFLPGDAVLWIPVVLRDGEPVAALPLYRHHGRLHALASDAHSEVFDVGVSDDDPTATAALVALLLRRRSCLERLDGDSPLLKGLRAAAPPMLVDAERSPIVALPSTPDALLARLSSKSRANVRRAERLLDGLGDVVVREHRGDDPTAPDAYATLIALERAGWKGADGTAIASRADTRQFYRRIAVDGPLRRWSRIVELRVDGVVVASQLDLEHAGRRHGLKMACTTALPSNQSPGTVLLWAVLRDCIARGVTTLELGGTLDGWKRRWASTAVERVRVRTWPLTPVGQLSYGAREHVKPVVRPLLRRVPGRR